MLMLIMYNRMLIYSWENFGGSNSKNQKKKYVYI